MSWLFEDPTYVLICGGVAVVGLLIAVFNTGRPIFLILAGVALALTAGGVLIERAVVTDYERVEQTLYDGAEAVASNDYDRVKAFLAPNAAVNTRQLNEIMRRIKFEKISIVRYEITLHPRSNPTAANVFVTVLAEFRMPELLTKPAKVELRLVNEGDRWMLQEFEAQ